MSHMYSSRHITHKVGTLYARICHLSTQCVTYLHNVSLSRFGESDNVGTPCISCGDVGIDSCSTAFQFHKYYVNVNTI